MAKCSFCGSDIKPGTGMIYYKKDGKRFDFCSSKCEVNTIHLGRNPRQTEWTEEYHRIKSQNKKETKERETKATA